MTTLADAVQEIERLKHDRAVWMEIVEFLARMVDQEVRPAEHGISAEGCIVNPVPQSVIKEFIDSINEESIEPLNSQIETLENLSVEETTDDKSPKGEVNQFAGRKKAGQKIHSSAKNSQVRQVGRRVKPIIQKPGPKAQSVG